MMRRVLACVLIGILLGSILLLHVKNLDIMVVFVRKCWLKLSR